MKNVRILTTVGMLLAVATVLGFFKVPITELIELRFAFLPVACTGMMFGALTGGIMGAAADILGYIVHPTGPFFPGFTISAAVQGVIYGLILHKKEITMKRLVFAQLADMLIVSMLLNPIWLSIIYGQAFMPVFAARIIKNIIMFPINLILLTAILKPAHKYEMTFISGNAGASR